jgi:hypothetical protein
VKRLSPWKSSSRARIFIIPSSAHCGRLLVTRVVGVQLLGPPSRCLVV